MEGAGRHSDSNTTAASQIAYTVSEESEMLVFGDTGDDAVFVLDHTGVTCATGLCCTTTTGGSFFFRSAALSPPPATPPIQGEQKSVLGWHILVDASHTIHLKQIPPRPVTLVLNGRRLTVSDSPSGGGGVVVSMVAAAIEPMPPVLLFAVASEGVTSGFEGKSKTLHIKTLLPPSHIVLLEKHEFRILEDGTPQPVPAAAPVLTHVPLTGAQMAEITAIAVHKRSTLEIRGWPAHEWKNARRHMTLVAKDSATLRGSTLRGSATSGLLPEGELNVITSDFAAAHLPGEMLAGAEDVALLGKGESRITIGECPSSRAPHQLRLAAQHAARVTANVSATRVRAVGGGSTTIGGFHAEESLSCEARDASFIRGTCSVRCTVTKDTVERSACVRVNRAARQSTTMPSR